MTKFNAYILVCIHTAIKLRKAAPHNRAKRIDQRTKTTIANHCEIEIDSSIKHLRHDWAGLLI